MKRIKAWTSLLLALVMALSLSVNAMAATTTDGKITVKNTVKDTTYSIYRIFDLESYSGTNYSYKVSTKWANFFVEGAAGLNYVTVENGYVTWKDGAKAEDFAAAALAFAKTEDATIAAEATKTSDSDGSSVVFDNLPLGYYLVDSSLGALCALTTTDKEAEVNEKNSKPGLDKQVQEDSTGAWGKVNDADIGQTVYYKAIVTVQGSAKGYVVHDKMEDGLTYDKVTSVTLNGTEVSNENNASYTVTSDATHTGEGETTVTHTFDIVFTDAFCNTLKSGDVIVVYYQATVNENAVVAVPEKNDAYLEYKDNNGETHKTEESETKTYTWDMDVLKYANGDESKVLPGAQFVLLNSDKTKVATVANGKLTGWADVPTAGADGTISWPENTVLTTDANGKIEIDGLDADTYHLREIKAPDGYNKLNEDIKVEITPTKSEDGKTLTYTTVETKVNNQSGTELPETGGMGTTLFYALGGVLVLAAVVLLVTRKRMSSRG